MRLTSKVTGSLLRDSVAGESHWVVPIHCPRLESPSREMAMPLTARIVHEGNKDRVRKVWFSPSISCKLTDSVIENYLPERSFLLKTCKEEME